MEFETRLREAIAAEFSGSVSWFYYFYDLQPFIGFSAVIGRFDRRLPVAVKEPIDDLRPLIFELKKAVDDTKIKLGCSQ
jgi:hypothetical protein